MSCRWHAWLFLLASSVVCVWGEQIVLQETGQVFTTAVFSVGNASDVFLDFQCIGGGVASNLIWFRRRPMFQELPIPLDLRSTSYSPVSGRARVFSDFIQDAENIVDDLVFLQCSRDRVPAVVNLMPVPTLFFTGAFPPAISPTEDLVTLCTSLLPQLPISTVSNTTAADHSYCLVDTARGSFRGPSITTAEITPPPPPVFAAEPLNITVRPINNVTRGAFSCVVYPGNVVQSITWFFRSGSGDPVPVGPPEVGVMAETVGGSSVLILESVGVEREGSYHCQAVVEGGDNPLISAAGHLELNGNVSGVEGIILAPPPSLSVSEGEATLVPCVGSSLPIFSGGSSAVTRGIPSSFGLTISSADRRDGGTITCEVGGVSAEVSLSVSAGLRFEEELEEEVVRFLNEDNSPLLLACEISGSPLPSVSFLFNSNPLTSPPRVSVKTEPSSCSVCVRSVLTIEEPMVGDVGMYQCLGQVGEEGSTTIVSTSYLNLQYLGNPVISYNGERVEGELILRSDEQAEAIQLVCSVEGHPVPSLSWDRNDSSPANGVQNITGFRETAGSVLEVAVNSLTDTVTFTCTASLMGAIETVTISITLQIEPPLIAVPPESIIAIDQELVNFTCEASGFPAPTISWAAFPSLPPSSITTSTNTSTLQFQASLSLNLTLVQCVAVNIVGTAFSSNATLTIAGPPGIPSLSVVPGAREVVIEWFSPFSHLPLTQFLLEISNSSGSLQPVVVTPSTSGSLNNITIDSLRPFSAHTVTLTSTSRAGNSTISDSFTTKQAAPDSAPTDVVVKAVDTERILVSWGPPPIETRNGEITQYLLIYSLMATPTDEKLSTFVGTEGLVSGLSPDTPYLFSVAAMTVALGPVSPSLAQRPYSLPPDPPEDPPGIPDDAAITTTTIPINLPQMNTSLFSHFWVVAIKLGDVDPSFLQGSPSDEFSNSQAFLSYSEDLPVNSPYIVTEVSAAGYDVVASGVFVLGDENGTRSSNDFPEQYRNGPLEEGTRYTVFVWGFLPAISASTDGVARRQSEGSRQYAVYTSSDFSPPTSTASRVPADDGLSPAVIAGIAIAVIIAFVLLPLVIVMAIVIANMWYRRVRKIGPPPSRHGSKRFKDNSVVTVMTNPNTRPDSALQEITSDDVRLPVSVKDFPDHVRKLHINSDHPFSEEYQLINIKSPGLPHLQGSATCNVMKNRYANINAYDETRVHLSFISGVEGSDFINANYIECYQKKTLYIAAQGPLPNTVHDFWRMVWEEESCCIVMLTNINEKGRVKCHQYWPDTGSLGLDDMTVTVIDTQELAYYSIRTFRLAKGGERREVKQFHYTGWPDFGVPDHPHPVLSFIRRLNNFKRTTQGPDIVHCSAGVGRTGTLITIQAMMKMIEGDGKVDIFNYILAMRRHRSYMVQTERQYIFIHDVVLEVIKMGSTEVSSQSLRKTLKQLQAQDPQTETSRLEEEFLRLNGLVEVDESTFSYAMNPLNMPKNREPKILPLDMYRVRLIMAPGLSCSDYINASYVDGYQHRHQYILTQGPMQSTVDDFWRMMWEHNISCILMLCENEEKGKEMCVQYWSKEKLKQHGDLFVEVTQETSYSSYTMREFSLTNTKINESRVLRHYQYVEWTEEAVPSNSAAVVDLIGVLQKAQHQNGGGPIVLHDSTPIGRAGTFCVLSSVLEQFKVEGVVDIFFFVHALRQQQPGLVATFEQYKFCYSSVLEFLDSFHLYSNFD